jgi:heat shock protein HspQ
MIKLRAAKFGVGQVVRHRKHPFRGVISEHSRPRKDQPYYHLFAENAETEYVAYVSEQNLLPDETGEPLRHPDIEQHFVRTEDGAYLTRTSRAH